MLAIAVQLWSPDFHVVKRTDLRETSSIDPSQGIAGMLFRLFLSLQSLESPKQFPHLRTCIRLFRESKLGEMDGLLSFLAGRPDVEAPVGGSQPLCRAATRFAAGSNIEAARGPEADDSRSRLKVGEYSPICSSYMKLQFIQGLGLMVPLHWLERLLLYEWTSRRTPNGTNFEAEASRSLGRHWFHIGSHGSVCLLPATIWPQGFDHNGMTA